MAKFMILAENAYTLKYLPINEMRFYEPTLHDNTDDEDMAHVLAKLHNFDVVYIAGMDRKFLKAGHAFAFATIIVSYPLDVERMPNKVPRQMIQIGYDCLYEIAGVNYYVTCLSKSVPKFIDEQGPVREANMKKQLLDAGEVLTEEALYQRYYGGVTNLPRGGYCYDTWFPDKKPFKMARAMLSLVQAPVKQETHPL
ncbi:hypothetical protein IWW34DRAFT_811856 [Fusarium oxysporum f. sp. albedinis]|nr:hypothetical protein IWW34DRAFT_811856 [Fusarium oxysporum f. sp. albedinis]